MTEITAKIITDSCHQDKRLTTMELTYPRFIHSEVMTHREKSRNSASSRAIPVKKQIEKILADPAMPLYYAHNQAGMQAAERMSDTDALFCEQIILGLRSVTAEAVTALAEIGLHKQWANRYLEPFQWHTVIVTASSWSNFFHQRAHSDAQPELEDLAYKMMDVLGASIPNELTYGEWHLPYLTESDFSSYDLPNLAKISASRCAGVSYLNQGRVDPVKDLERYEKLVTGDIIHYSPLEHVATPWKKRPFRRWVQPLGNFNGWAQLRHNMNYFKMKRKRLK